MTEQEYRRVRGRFEMEMDTLFELPDARTVTNLMCRANLDFDHYTQIIAELHRHGCITESLKLTLKGRLIRNLYMDLKRIYVL